MASASTPSSFSALVRRQALPSALGSMLAPVSALVLTRILGPEQYGVLGAVARCLWEAPGAR